MHWRVVLLGLAGNFSLESVTIFGRILVIDCQKLCMILIILVKKEIEEFEENAEGDKEADSDEEDGKKGKKKK